MCGTGERRRPNYPTPSCAKSTINAFGFYSGGCLTRISNLHRMPHTLQNALVALRNDLRAFRAYPSSRAARARQGTKSTVVK